MTVRPQISTLSPLFRDPCSIGYVHPVPQTSVDIRPIRELRQQPSTRSSTIRDLQQKTLFSVSAQNGKLFLVAGQSNAVGQGESTLSAVCNQGTAFEYNATTDALQHLQDPMGQGINNLNSAVTGSVGPAFAKTLNSLISQPIYMISAARSGSSLHAKAELSNYGTWDETGTLAVFGCAVAKTKKAIQKTGLALSGIIWLQGERDANAIAAGTETEAEYKETLIKLIARFRAQFGYRLPFYIVLTGLQGTISNGIPVASSSTGNYKVRQIQMEVAKTIPNVFVAFTSTHTFFAKGLMKPEGTTVHYTQPAYNQIGDSVARFVATIPYDTIAKVSTVYQPVNSNPQIIVDNTDAACTFDASWTITTNVAGYYGLNFAYSSSATSGSTKWAKWTPTLPVNAMYRIYMRWASSSTRASLHRLKFKMRTISRISMSISVMMVVSGIIYAHPS